MSEDRLTLRLTQSMAKALADSLALLPQWKRQQYVELIDALEEAATDKHFDEQVIMIKITVDGI